VDFLDGYLEGRITQGKSHKGDIPDLVTLNLKGRSLYQLQRFFEDEVRKGGDYSRVRWMVLMAEELRISVGTATGKIPNDSPVRN
jgi:hypothetical protein